MATPVSDGRTREKLFITFIWRFFLGWEMLPRTLLTRLIREQLVVSITSFCGVPHFTSPFMQSTHLAKKPDCLTRSFYTGLLSVRHSPSLLLLTLDIIVYDIIVYDIIVYDIIVYYCMAESMDQSKILII